MEGGTNASLWLEEGYTLFAMDGPEGVQIERLARILGLNKSGFYHYFGSFDLFCNRLLLLHETKASRFFEDIRKVQNIDPEYLKVVVEHKVPIVFQMQLLRAHTNPAFVKLAASIDGQEEQILRNVWSRYIGFDDHPVLAMRYFTMVRDMFYTRMSLQNISYPFLRALIREARDVMQNIVRLSPHLLNDTVPDTK